MSSGVWRSARPVPVVVVVRSLLEIHVSQALLRESILVMNRENSPYLHGFLGGVEVESSSEDGEETLDVVLLAHVEQRSERGLV